MAAVGKVPSRGQVTLPREIRKAVNIQPGDSLLFRASGPSTIEITVLPRTTLAEALERFHVDEPLDTDTLREAAYEDAAREAINRLDG
jgi:AbrB family looped-hinge helix DNA binding protein